MSLSHNAVEVEVAKGLPSVGAVTDSGLTTMNGAAGASGISDVKMGLSSVTSVEHAQPKKDWIPMEEHVLWKPKQKVKVISIGCGFSGLTMAHKIQHKYQMDDRVEHVLYEKNSDIGGTWFEVRPTLTFLRGS